MKAVLPISPAALSQAYFRTFYDTPYAGEIANLTHAKQHFNTYAGGETKERLYLVPLFEARHKAITRLLAESLDHLGSRQILDLGSGLSPEGLIFCRHYYPLTYVETDLEEAIEYKRQVLRRLSQQIPTGLHLESADVFKPAELNYATRHFRPKVPLIILTQGLLSFLPIEEKLALAASVHTLLCKFGGIWLTPDPAFHNEFRREISLNFPTHLYLDQRNNDRDLRPHDHAWSNEADADEFFSTQGFVINKRPQLIDLPLTTPARLGLSVSVMRPLIDNLKRYGKVWLLSARPQPSPLEYAHA